jgi:hypothetical protein
MLGYRASGMRRKRSLVHDREQAATPRTRAASELQPARGCAGGRRVGRVTTGGRLRDRPPLGELLGGGSGRRRRRGQGATGAWPGGDAQGAAACLRRRGHGRRRPALGSHPDTGRP